VMLSDGGVMKRIDLASDGKALAQVGGPGVNPEQAGAQQQGQQGPQAPVGDAGPVLGGAIPPGAAPVENNTPEPPMAPGAVSSQMPGSNQIGPSGQAPAQNNQPPVQMAPPMRSSATPGGQGPQTQ
jgi:general secretion pathway protein C